MTTAREKSRKKYRLSIGEAAKQTGLTAKTIRYYEQIGLIPKARRRNLDGSPHTGGSRIYSDEDLGRLRFIRHARLIDLSLADTRKLLGIADRAGCPGEHPAYREVLQRQLRQIDERINHLLGLRTAVQGLLGRKSEMGRDACTWSTCACMQPKTSQPPIEGSGMAEAVSTKVRQRTHRKRRTNHV